METATLETQRLSDLQQSIESNIAEHRSWYMLQGGVFILAGLLAVILPSATAIGIELLIGALLLVSGIVQAFASFRCRVHWWSLLSSLASVVVGGLMLSSPSTGTLALATIVAIFLAIEGVAELLLSFQFRPARNWVWLMLSGLTSVVLATLLFVGWPAETIVFLGIIIGVNFLLYGASIIAVATSVNDQPQ
jgi:uncharacterized membrane protein HdeD (DUF308 family)